MTTVLIQPTNSDKHEATFMFFRTRGFRMPML